MKITNVIRLMCENEAHKLGISILDVEYLVEHGMKILRVIADKPGEGLSVDDSALLNQQISDCLDNMDIDEENYYLEVSSPGIERHLKTNKDLLEAVNKYICIKTYQKIDGNKEFYGYLKSIDPNYLTIEINIKGKSNIKIIPVSQISLVRLAVKF